MIILNPLATPDPGLPLKLPKMKMFLGIQSGQKIRPPINDSFFGPETPQINSSSSRVPSARPVRVYEPEEYQTKSERSRNSISKDLRFAGGTTTQSTYLDHHAASSR